LLGSAARRRESDAGGGPRSSPPSPPPPPPAGGGGIATPNAESTSTGRSPSSTVSQNRASTSRRVAAGCVPAATAAPLLFSLPPGLPAPSCPLPPAAAAAAAARAAAARAAAAEALDSPSLSSSPPLLLRLKIPRARSVAPTEASTKSASVIGGCGGGREEEGSFSPLPLLPSLSFFSLHLGHILLERVGLKRREGEERERRKWKKSVSFEFLLSYRRPLRRPLLNPRKKKPHQSPSGTLASGGLRQNR